MYKSYSTRTHAAESTTSRLMRDPPQPCPIISWIETAYGYFPTSASLPPIILLSLNSLYDSWLDTVHEEHKSTACGSNLMIFIFVVCFCFRKQFMFFMRFVLRNMSQDYKFMRIWDAKCEWAPAYIQACIKQECDWIKTNLIPRTEWRKKSFVMESKRSKIGN